MDKTTTPQMHEQMKNKRLGVQIILPLIIFIILTVLAECNLVNDGQSITLYLDGLVPIPYPLLTTVCRVGCIISGMMILMGIVRFVLSVIKPKSNRSQTLILLAYNAVSYISIIVGLIGILLVMGVNVIGIATTVGILGIVVGFGAESLIADIFTGVCMIFENQFNVGDIIEINGFRGKVVSIGVRTTSIRDSGENIKIFNNSDVKNVLNCSSEISVAVCDIPISYDAKLEDAEKVLMEEIAQIQNNYSDVFEKIDYAGVEELADSSVNLRVVGKTTEQNIFRARRILNREIYLAFNREHIDIPYPQIVVHTNH